MQPSTTSKNNDSPSKQTPKPTNTLHTKTNRYTKSNHNTQISRKPSPLLPTPSQPPQDNRKALKKYCFYCDRNGHTDNTCRWLTWCDFCNRGGHSVQDCRSLRAQKQNQTLSHQTTALVDTLNKHHSQSTSLLSNPLTNQQTNNRQQHATRQ